MDESSLKDHDTLMAQEPDVKRLQDAYALLRTDPPRALVELEELANRGSVVSMLYLGETYAKEPYVDRIKSEKWYKSAYHGGSATGLFALGALYYREGKYAEAEKTFADGVAKSDPVSMYWLASVYVVDARHRGKSTEIRTLLEKSATLGHIRAKHDLSLFLMKGRYGKRDVLKGIWLYITNLIDAFKVSYRDPTSWRLW